MAEADFPTRWGHFRIMGFKGHFGPGSAAVTTISHIGVTIWQIDDTPTFEIALFRSFADRFWHWMKATSAALGVGLVRDARSAPV